MTHTVQLIENTLKKALNPTSLQVVDDKADHIGHAHQDSGHFTVIISAPIFAGKTPIQRHRLIYDALGSLMQTHIHALRIQATVPSVN